MGQVSFKPPQTRAVAAGFASAVSPSLEAWWKLDETSGLTAADSSGNARDATYKPSVSYGMTTIRDGGLRSARPPGASALATLAHSSWMNLTTFSVTAWCRVQTIANNRGYVGRYGGVGGWILWTNVSQWSFLITSSVGDKVISGPSATNGEERFMALTYDGTTMSAYLDGTLVNTLTFSLGTITGTAGIGIDAYSNSGTDNNAAMQDVTIHSTALSGAQVSAIWTTGNAGL